MASTASADPAPGPSADQAVLSGPVRTAMLDLAGALPVSEVSRIFRDEGFGPSPGVNLADAASGPGQSAVNSRTLAQQYLNLAEPSNPAHVIGLLHALEELLWRHEAEHGATTEAERLRRHLRREGYGLDEDGRIRLPARLLEVGILSRVRDPRALETLLSRIEHALPDDPMLAIGTAKELIEATCLTVLAELSIPVEGEPDVPELVHRTESALSVHPRSGDGMDAVPQVRTLLGKLTGIPNDLAALRNRAGSGHGRAEVPAGLSVRHGRLALNAALTWCRFILDTLADPRASWRRTLDVVPGLRAASVEKYAFVAKLGAGQRLATVLLDLGTRFGSPAEEAGFTVLPFSLTPAALSELSVTSLRTTEVCLRRLAEQDAVRLRRRSLLVDVDKLRAFLANG